MSQMSFSEVFHTPICGFIRLKLWSAPETTPGDYETEFIRLPAQRSSRRRSDFRCAAIDYSCTFSDSQRFVIECRAPSTTICLGMKNSIIFISALSLVAMMLASCNSIPTAFAPDETATTGVTTQTNETRPERSAEDSVNSISGGHY